MNFKIAFVGAALMAFGGIFTVGCGGNDCEAAADTILAKQEACGVTAAATTSTTGASVECTEALGTQSLCVAACTDGADCSLIKADPAKPPTAEQSTAFLECLGKCTAAQ
jgi:hypothetical protein